MRDVGQQLAGRRILVTGASRGIAAAIAEGLAMAGAQVVVNHSPSADAAAGQADAAEALVKKVSLSGGRIELAPVDLAVAGAGRALAETALAGGPVDSVVLSASTQVHVPFLRHASGDVARQVQLNIIANIDLLQALLPAMVEARFGRVLSIGSVQEVAPSPEMPIYSMTKAAMKNLIENLAASYAANGVTFNSLSPGLVRTDRNAFRRTDPGDWARAQALANPIGRAADVQEMVPPALYLLSREAAFVTGATLYATGGGHIPGLRLSVPVAEAAE
jgi:NAD(P)-dependent dehydrogenase (short-subunit alcohol dehydrogenase family)